MLEVYSIRHIIILLVLIAIILMFPKIAYQFFRVVQKLKPLMDPFKLHYIYVGLEYRNNATSSRAGSPLKQLLQLCSREI